MRVGVVVLVVVVVVAVAAAAVRASVLEQQHPAASKSMEKFRALWWRERPRGRVRQTTV